MNRTNVRATPTLSLALAACAPAGSALAAPIVVLNTGEQRDTIISHGDFYIPCLQPVLELVPYSDPSSVTNALFMNFAYLGSDLYGAVTGNALPSFPPFPFQTPALYLPGGFRIQDEVLDSPAGFVEPTFDPEFGDVRPVAFSHGTQSFSDFNLESYSDGDMAYIGYAASDFSMFGYMQIERVNVLDWKLVGYAFDPSGAPLLVQNLIPTPSSLAALLLAACPRRRRRNT
jgi:hypothetical protein